MKGIYAGLGTRVLGCSSFSSCLCIDCWGLVYDDSSLFWGKGPEK